MEASDFFYMEDSAEELTLPKLQSEASLTRKSLYASKNLLEDPRKAVGGSTPKKQKVVSSEELKKSFIIDEGAQSSHMVCFQNLVKRLSSAAAAICTKTSEKNTNAAKPQPRRWYKVNRVNDTVYNVRADDPSREAATEAGTASSHVAFREGTARSACVGATSPSAAGKRYLQRRATADGTAINEDDEDDILEQTCTICYMQKMEVIILPCKHGGMCEGCLRSSIFAKPAQKGGRCCPLCRRKVQEVIRIDKDSLCGSWGYAIKVDAFCRD